MCAIKGPPGNLSPQSEKSATMARTYPLTVPYNQCLGARTDQLSFSSLYLEDLKSGRSQYLSSMKQLADALPKTENPTSRFALRGHIARPGQQRLRHSMRAAMWWMLPSNGAFCRSSHSLQYYLTRQGRRVVLRGGDVTLPLLESYLNWVADPMPPPTRRLDDLTSPVSLRIRRPWTARASFQDACDLVAVEGSSRPPRPMKIQHPAWLTPRPHLGHQPMKIRLPAR